MILNLKNLIKGGTQKVRFAIKRKEPQISVRIIETKEAIKSFWDLIIGPIWSGDHQIGVNQIDIQLKCLLPPEHKLKIQLVDSLTDWLIKETEILSGSTSANLQTITGAQNLNLKFQLYTNQNQLPKLGVTYYIKEININTLVNHSVTALKRSITVDHTISTKFPKILPKKIQIVDLEPLLKWILDPQPVRKLFINSVDSREIGSDSEPESSSGSGSGSDTFSDSESDTVSDSDSDSESGSEFESKLLQNQTEWDQLQKEIQELVDQSIKLTKTLTETEAKKQLYVLKPILNTISQLLPELDVLTLFIKRLKLELYQIEIVLTQELNESLGLLLRSYSIELSKEILKIGFLIESINIKLENLLKSYQIAFDLEQNVINIKNKMNELAITYQTKITTGQTLLKSRQKILLEPVVKIHQKLTLLIK